MRGEGVRKSIALLGISRLLPFLGWPSSRKKSTVADTTPINGPSLRSLSFAPYRRNIMRPGEISPTRTLLGRSPVYSPTRYIRPNNETRHQDQSPRAGFENRGDRHHEPP
ncbi:hypothetical protein HYQ46_010930 [Verticillium longisporum]|nr:hypothetical protein HYQ46_010930 [Verticillium longisporum]